MSKYGLKELKSNQSASEQKLMKKLFWSTGFPNIMINYSRMLGPGFAVAMYPVINEFYKGKSKEEKSEALLRQGKFWNMEATMHSFCVGIIASMEKDHALTGNTSVESMDAVKASLIGPMSAIGDTIFWITWRLIITGIALNFALQGNVFGPLLFIVGYNLPKFIARWYLLNLGYNMGNTLLMDMVKNNIMSFLTRAASILGVFMVGGMIPMLVKVPVVATFSMNGVERSLADIFNGIVPGFLELMVAFLMVKFVRKKVNAIFIILGTFIICILGAFVGIF